MKLTFDYYHNLEQVDLFLCNPDGRELFPLPGKSRNLTLRFNDLSELTFEVDSKITLSNNAVVDLEAYDYIQTKRLVYATNIGWFQISGVDEHDNGVVKYKTVKAESYQSVLKNKGFISEERVYCFYNPNDPHDDRYDSTKEDSIPSVLGQWSKQLGIKQALSQGLSEPTTPYDDWTVTYIHSSLIYAGAGSKCRTFKESVTYGYDWMVNDVEEAFEVVILFDFMYKTIHVMTPNEVAQRVNVIYTFNNFMKSVDINEASEDIVTVLNCNGDNCDITAVNPTGTNYICDFSYYMDKTNYRWMSSALIAKLEQWKADCDAEKDTYTDYVSQLRSLWLQKTECTTSLQEMSLSLQDLKNAQNKRSVVGSGTPGALCGIVAAESVRTYRTKVNEVETVIGGRSIKSGTDYYSTDFTGAKTITAYQYSPTYNAETKKWVFSGASKRATADSIVADNLSDSNTSGVSYWYFSDVSDGSSYCKLQSAVTVNKDSATSTYYCGGFDRYIAYSYPIVEEGTGVTTYTDSVQEWINLRESLVNSLNSTNSSLEASINSVSASLDAISSRLNILSYFASTPALLRELNCYWIEGDYTNDNIAVLEETTPEKEIDLANELLDAGYIELSKVCQPRFSFSLESRDATKQYEFKDQMCLLELGKIITIEKEEGLWYYPALLEISLNLDNSEEFSMTFANAMRLDDWGYTYADLISDASSTSRKVSANWQDILAYSKERAEISSLIKDPLDTTLRASFANMVNQEFTVDKNGILGRKKVSETSDEFEDEQVRLINNLLIFTDDNWETAKTALGKIYYTDEDGNQVTSYGLIAETIIGSLIMGERLKIKNTNSTVELGAEGITIKKADGTVVFSAKPDGSLVVRNYASQSSVDSLTNRMSAAELTIDAHTGQIALKASQSSVDSLTNRMSAAESSIEQNATDISAKVSQTYGNSSSSFGWKLQSTGFYVYSDASTVMEITSDGLELTGKITATSGSIGAFNITNDGLQSQYITLNASSIFFPTQASFNLANYVTIFHNTSSNVSYISTTGDRDFEIRNMGGAGIRFKADSVNQSLTQTVTISQYITEEDVGTTSKPRTKYTLHFRYTVSNSGVLSSPMAVTVWYKVNGLTSTREESLTINIPAYSNTGLCSETATSTIYKFLGISLTQGNYGTSVSVSTVALNTTNNILYSLGSFCPNTSATASSGYLLGDASHLWRNLTAYSTTITTSDRNEKHNITNLTNEFEGFFDELKPVSFVYNHSDSGRTHLGFIAQDVESSLQNHGIDTQHFAGICIDVNEDTGEKKYFLRYEEFIPLNTLEILKLKERVRALESEIICLKNIILNKE